MPFQVDLTPFYIFLTVGFVVSCVPAIAFCYTVNRFINALDRKWQRESEHDTIRADAERLNRPFTRQ